MISHSANENIKPEFVVTIDGPAASGKTSVSRELAKNLGWKWVSTGAFYRGLALLVVKNNGNIHDEDSVVALNNKIPWRVNLGEQRTEVFISDVDVTDDIYSEKMGELASVISQFPKVRKELLEAQRQCARQGFGLVAEGRDCGTVVFPEAEVKVYLEANSKDRAQRRALEQGAKVSHVQKSQLKRDEQDMNRKLAPLQVPENAISIDTSDLTLEEVTQKILNIVKSTDPK